MFERKLKWPWTRVQFKRDHWFNKLYMIHWLSFKLYCREFPATIWFIPIQPNSHPPMAALGQQVYAQWQALKAPLRMRIHLTYLSIFHLMHTQVPSTWKPKWPLIFKAEPCVINGITKKYIIQKQFWWAKPIQNCTVISSQTLSYLNLVDTFKYYQNNQLGWFCKSYTS